MLSSPQQLAANVRALFHSSTRKAANTGCLLEQVASHIILGLSSVVEAAAKPLLGPFQPAVVLQRAAAAATASAGAGAAGGAGGGGPSSAPTAAGGGGQAPPGAAAATAAAAAPGLAASQLSRTSLVQAAELALGDSLARVLAAVGLVGGMVRAVQQHYEHVILPHLAGSTVEGRACAVGLAALVKAAEERGLAALQRTLTLLFNQVRGAGGRGRWVSGEARTRTCALLCVGGTPLYESLQGMPQHQGWLDGSSG